MDKINQRNNKAGRTSDRLEGPELEPSEDVLPDQATLPRSEDPGAEGSSDVGTPGIGLDSNVHDAPPQTKDNQSGMHKSAESQQEQTLPDEVQQPAERSKHGSGGKGFQDVSTDCMRPCRSQHEKLHHALLVRHIALHRQRSRPHSPALLSLRHCCSKRPQGPATMRLCMW